MFDVSLVDRVPTYKSMRHCKCAHTQNSLATFAHADTPRSAYRRMQTNHSTDAFSMTDWTFERYRNLRRLLFLLPRMCSDMTRETFGVHHPLALRTLLFRIGPLLAIRIFFTMKSHMLVKERTIEFHFAIRAQASVF